MLEIIKETKIEIKKSKFITLYLKVDNLIEFNAYIESLHKEHKKAAHVCFAYKINDGNIHIKANDDGEPKGTAGYPILRAIERNDLVNASVVIIRYFGGTKLGSGPLLRTYSKCANEILKK
ncbi:MAG: IMPACT family protein [Mycoplasma sp.]